MRRRGLLPACVAVTLLLTCAPASALETTEVWPVPPSGRLELAGHGYGHGRGLSQWGAHGAAVRGLRYREILDFYYPGTQHAVQAAAPIRVWLKADNDAEARVDPAAGLAATNGTVSRALPSSDARGAIRGWRVRRDPAGLLVEYLDTAAVWRPHDLTGTGRSSTPVTFTATGGLVRLVLPDGSRREYRGGVRAVAVGSSPALRSVAVLGMEDYLRSVVPAEMPAGWPTEALRAQSVAARTYASFERRAASSSAAHDTCDDTACQVFRGTAAYRADGSLIARYEAAATDQAVAATAGEVRHHEGAPAFTQFGAANGGFTVGGGRQYLVARADPYDGVVANSAHRWRTTLAADALARRWPAVGSLRSVRVSSRDGNGQLGGRTVSVTLTGSSGSMTLTGEQFRSALGLRSTWWVPTNTARRVGDWQGDARADLIARDSRGDLLLYAGAGGGAFGAVSRIGTGWQQMTALVRAGDWDGDARGDLLARRGDGALLFYPGDGVGGFRPARQVGSGWQVLRTIVGAGIWDADGFADLLAVDSGGRLLLYRGDGRGGFLGARYVGGGWDQHVHVVPIGDWDGDGRGDLVAAAGDGALWLYRGDGAGGFLGARRIGSGWQVFDGLVSVGDWDTDGRPDLLAVQGSGTLWLYRGDGSGGFLGARQVGSGWWRLNALA